jgi:hypothetical protein
MAGGRRLRASASIRLKTNNWLRRIFFFFFQKISISMILSGVQIKFEKRRMELGWALPLLLWAVGASGNPHMEYRKHVREAPDHSVVKPSQVEARHMVRIPQFTKL